MIDFVRKNAYGIKDLVDIVAILRMPDGCPWDREQTHASLRRGLLEEACEVIEAIEEENPAHLQEELGDVLLQVVFHARIEQEQGVFDFDAVCDTICKKLIFRHPHVFGDVAVDDTAQVLANWEELKKKEKGQQSVSDAMEAVARSLPALWRAEKVQGKAAKAGFDWHEPNGALDKLGEELAELQAAMDAGEAAHIEEELGDLLFTAVNLARKLDIDPEEALTKATDKFQDRFALAEKQADKPLKELDDAAWDKLWEQAKKESY